VTVTSDGGASTRVTNMTYDQYLAGYLATVQDPVGNVTTYDQRDQDGRVLDVELPDFGLVPQSHVETTYDANGNVTSVTVPPATPDSSRNWTVTGTMKIGVPVKVGRSLACMHTDVLPEPCSVRNRAS
jgi:hypothetical protein